MSEDQKVVETNENVGEDAANLQATGSDSEPDPATDAPPLRNQAGDIIAGDEEVAGPSPDPEDLKTNPAESPATTGVGTDAAAASEAPPDDMHTRSFEPAPDQVVEVKVLGNAPCVTLVTGGYDGPPVFERLRYGTTRQLTIKAGDRAYLAPMSDEEHAYNVAEAAE